MSLHGTITITIATIATVISIYIIYIVAIAIAIVIDTAIHV